MLEHFLGHGTAELSKWFYFVPQGLWDGVLGAFLAWLSVKCATRFRRWRFFRKIRWVLPITKQGACSTLYVRPSLEVTASGLKPPRSKRGYTHSCETEALAKLSSFLDDLPVSIQFDYYHSMETSAENWLLLGLGANNDLSDLLLEDISENSDTGLSLIEPEDAHYFFRSATGQTFSCQHDDDYRYESRVTLDYGIIYRKVMFGGATVLLCGGIHMHGTQAALDVALDPRFQAAVKKRRCRQFIQVVRVRVSEDGLKIIPQSICWGDEQSLPLICLERETRLLQRIFSRLCQIGRPKLRVDAKKNEY